ncbi:ShlB/FhaC/HecB family hemolysin secretion/activation protein [Anabaena sp. FACHB-1237]|uniref:ShlB/FhaC/HecB family hemolysin secretion/activation protein n=1 Tax=Anabaena sp. FACHB-1237 TaxID=2692769 RepID=UPI00168024FA|nr:ShlB/FhaC/HecB family hemolysin secretion/activation protein [Anabaena sp. FACHB-1237]MBD2137064.1 ShlB/FhaC/HecB family hemolysin secretion/activation protein [Anabaena sp. FACHB-1237]
MTLYYIIYKFPEGGCIVVAKKSVNNHSFNSKQKLTVFNSLFFGINSLVIFTNSLLPVKGDIVRENIAQNPTNNVPQDPSALPNTQPLPEVQPLPSLEELLPKTPENSNIPQPSLEKIPGTITVSQFQIIGSTVFSGQKLMEVLEPYTKKPISFAELLKAQEAITQLYIKEGYITSGAFIPPQELKDGIVKIEVIEGEIEAINITGLQRLKESYLRNRLGLATTTPLNQNRLLRSLQMLQLDPLIANLSAELSAGSRPGVSILEVKVREAKTFYAILGVDNQRSPSVGTIRRQAQLSHNNFLGFGDRFHIGYVNTDGSNSLDDLSYVIPVNLYNGTISLNYSSTNSNIIENPFNTLDIQSESRNYQFTYRQPIKRTPNQEINLGITASRQESKTSLLNIPYPLSIGANDQGETKISALRLFQEYTNRNNEQVFALRSQFSLGLNLFDPTINTNNTKAPDGRFISWRGQAQYLRLLTPDTTLLFRGDLQLADRPLLPLEQISIGGQQTVRGYRQDNLLADNGFFASAEVRTPILKIPQWQTTVQLVPFFDFGTLWNHADSEVTISKKTLSSVGLGLRFSVGNKLNARLDWGIPLVTIPRSGDTLQENGIYFTLEYNPF